MYKIMAKFKDLQGKVLKDIVNNENELIFTLESGEKWRLYHPQDCCENVEIEDIDGDIKNLIGYPILLAEEVVSHDNPEGVKIPEQDDSFTWTFYKLRTVNDSVTIRWYGESNGYYSETVYFEKVNIRDIEEQPEEDAAWEYLRKERK